MTTSLSSRRWTEEAIIEAIQKWVEIHGEPPTIKQWYYAQPPYYPCAFTVVDVFGTLGNGIEAAGFARRPTGRPSKRVKSGDLIALAHQSGVPIDVVLAKNPDANNGWFYVQKAKDVLKNAPDDPLRDLLWAILTGKRFAE